MKIFIKTLHGTTHTLDVSPSDTMEAVKKQLGAIINVPIESQNLVFINYNPGLFIISLRFLALAPIFLFQYYK